MKILCISDTHEQHKWLNQFLFDYEFIAEFEMIICAGDTANDRNPIFNHHKQLEFIDWFSELPIEHKIYVPGNHNTSDKMIDDKVYTDKGIIRLMHNSVTIKGINIFGSPFTPTFGLNWAYNVNRNKLDSYWQAIPEDTDILVTHGPPKGILDLAGRESSLTEQTGDKALLNHVFRVKPKYHIFGHIHDEENIFNYGTRMINDITFVNATTVNLHYTPINEPIKIEI